MPTAPSVNAKLSLDKAHLHPLTKGKTYKIKTKRQSHGNARLAFIAFLIKGKRREVLLKVDELVHDRNYTVKFVAETEGQSLLLTHWNLKGGKWVQAKSELDGKPKKKVKKEKKEVK